MVAAQKRLEQTPLLEEVFADKTSDPAGQPLEDAAVTFKAAPIQSALVASPSPSPLSDPQTVAFPVWLPDVLQPERPEPPSVPLQSRPTFRTTRKTAKTSAWVWAFGAAVLVFLLGGAAGRFYLLPGNNSTCADRPDQAYYRIDLRIQALMGRSKNLRPSAKRRSK